MATLAPPTPGRPRDAAGFGGLVPASAVGRGGETLVASLGLEHHADGAIMSLLVLSAAPGMLDWDPAIGLVMHDDRGERYEGAVLDRTAGLGAMTVAVGITPAIPATARRLELVVDGLARVSPVRGGGPGVARALNEGPWNVIVDLVPDRTVAPVPAEPGHDIGEVEAGTVPIRAHGTFVDVVPVGQVRFAPEVTVCAVALERYWDRSVLTLLALGPGGETPAPAVGRAAVDVWDDRGRRYRAAPFQGSSGDAWSEVAIEVVPAIPPDASALGISVADVPLGEGAGSVPVPGPFVFGVRLPAE